MNRRKFKVEGRRSRILTFDFRLSTRRPGFTLIELVVVILALAILSLLAVEKIAGLDSGRDRLAADELRVNLRYIRNLAMARERMTRVVFSVASNSYAVEICDTNGSFALAANPATQLPWVVNVGRRFPGVEFASVNIGGSNLLYFNITNGAPCISTNAQLASEGAIVFNSGRRLTVAPGTGYIDLE